MSKVKIYQKAWSQALKGDFSLVDQIYHPEYRSFDLRTGIYTNIDDDKVIVTTENEEIFTSYPDVLYENDEFLCIIAYQKKFLIQKQDTDRSLQRLIIKKDRFLAKKLQYKN
jgi:hypothetical protein